MAQIDGKEQIVTVANASTTYVGCGGDASLVQSIHVQWDTAFVGTITFEDSNRDPLKVSLTSVVKGEWIVENPSSAVVSVTSTDGTTGGATPTGASIPVAGGTAGGAMVHVGNSGSRRWRSKIAATTGGTLIFATNAKE